ncbi:hypothetical protein VZO05_15655 (plasmid) [Aggregatilineales bacterium SYSU G02658]
MTRLPSPTPRVIAVLVLLGVLFVLGFSSQAQEDFTYLYYFESDDANLSAVDSKEYAFATLRGERVTIVVYGLDALVRPRLRVFNAAGTQIGVGQTPPDQPYITFFQINATGNDLYTFRVERAGGEGGLARVMLFEGEPLNQDLTLLDDLNPLLPSRAFMVAGRDNEEGLRVLVEVLDVPYYDQRPVVFASRGTLAELPDITERFNPSDTFLWFNRDGRQVYFVNIRPTPEESTIVTEDIPLPLFNVGNFFYFDYYFTVGAGSDPIRLVTRQDCTTAPNRPECVRESPTFGRTEINLPPPTEAPSSTEIFRPDRGELPPVQECVGGVGEVRFFTSPVIYTSTDCDDFLSGSPGNDRLAGGPGNDTILGNGGDDIIFGDEGDDELFGGPGNDFIDGGPGNDLLSGGPGNDTLEGGGGIDTVTYADSPDGVVINLTNHRNPLVGGTAVSASQGSDVLFNIEVIIGSNFNDTITGSSDNDVLFGLDGDDILFGNGGDDTIHAGAGNDEVRIGSPLGGSSVVTLGLGNDLVLVNGPGSATITGGDETGPLSSDGNDTFTFLNGAAGTFQLSSQWGDDVVDFSAVTSGVTFNLSSLVAQNPFGALFITLLNDSINVLIGSAFDDVLTGSSVNKNCDYIDAGAGNDLVFSTPSNGADCALFDSVLTDDVLMGGAGNDTISYALLADVNVNLLTGTAAKNGGTMFDVLSGFENVIGSSGNDTITGDNQANILAGGQGNDLILAGGGNDTILAGFGSDTIDGGTGINLVDFSAALAGRTIRLDGVLADDLITNVSDLIGTNFADIITGSAGNNVIDAGAGNDLINVNAGVFGTDVVTGGAGRDTLNAALQDVATTVTINADAGTLTNSNGTVTFNTTEAILTGIGNDSFQINNGLSLITNPLEIDGGGGVNTYNFDGLAQGYVQLTPTTSDLLTVDNASAANFSGLIVGTWQEILTNLFVLLTAPINPSCGAATETVFLNFTNGNDLVGDAPLNLTSCPSDDIFNGLAGFDIITYATVPLAVGDLIFTIVDGPQNQVAIVESTSGDIGTDTIRNFERIVGRTGGRDVFAFQPLASVINLEIDGNGGNDQLDFSLITTPVNLNLSLATPQAAYTNLQLTLLSPIREVLLGSGNDTLIGSAGNDLIFGNDGHDSIMGGDGDDTIWGGAGNDIIFGGSGDDEIRGGLGSDTVFGGMGNDTFIETAADGGSDSYRGGDGDDLFLMVLDGFSDLFFGDAGYDVFQYTNNAPVVGTVGTISTFNDGAGFDVLSSIEEIITGGGNDSITLDAGGINILRTGAGDDTVTATLTSTTPFVFLEDGDDVFIAQGITLVNMFVNGGTGTNALVVHNDVLNLPVMVDAAIITTSGDTYLSFASLTMTGTGSELATVVDDSFITSIVLGGGDDVLVVQVDGAANTYDGGAGFDLVDYSAIGGNLTLTLDTDTTIGSDTIRNFEALVLGNANYTITEQAGSPFTTIATGTGTDVVTLNGDNLTALSTGAGDDSVTVGAFTTPTAIDMGAGDNSLTYATGAVNLTVAISGPLSGTVSDGAITDTFSGVTLLTLADGDDAISVNVDTGGMIVDAGAGADEFTVGASASNAGLVGGAGDDTFVVAYAGQLGLTLTGGVGIDTADYSANVVNLTVTVGGTTSVGTHDLEEIEALLLGSGSDVVTVADDSGMLEIVLGGGDDVLVVQVDGAANTYDGGAGFDLADYSAIGSNLTLTLDTDTTIGSDTIRNFEALVLGNANYTITEQAGSPFTTITTGTGTDVVTLNGDKLTALSTGSGDDSVTVGAFTTPTAIDMGAGDDSLTYATGAVNLTVAISGPLSGTVSNGAITDTFSGVTLLTLADGDDAISVNVDTGGMIVNAGAGADEFTVGASASNAGLVGGAGDDTFVVAYAGQLGLTLTGGVGIDTADYSANVVNLTVTVGGTTSVGTHDLEEIEALLLGSGSDVVTVTDDSGMLEIVLGGGDDVLVVQVDGAANTYDGGAGIDTADYSAIGGNLTLTLDTDTTIGSDTIRNFEALVLGNANYTITEQAGSPFTTITTGTGTDVVTLNGDNLTALSTGSGDDSVTVGAFTTSTVIDMGAGDDSLTYATGAVNLTVAISGPLSGTVSNGAITDTFSGVTLLTLADGDDAITIAASATVEVDSGAGDDTFNITYNGSVVREFNAGAHTVADVAIYAGSSSHTVTVNANLITVVVGAGAQDRLTDFEVLTLGAGADNVTIVNDSVPYTINLGGGADVVTLASPTFVGGSTFNGGGGTDTLVVGTGAGTLVTASLAGSGFTLNGTAPYTLNSIETVSIDKVATGTITVNNPTGVTTLNTSAGSDTVTVTNSGSLTAINTGNGNDSINAVNVASTTIIDSGAGDDTFRITFDTNDNTFDGGAGVDVADYSLDNPTTDFDVTVAASVGTQATVSDGVNTDTLNNFESIVTGGGNDVFTINIDNIVGTWTFNAGGSTSGNQFIFVGTGAGTNTAQINITTASGSQDVLDFSGITGSGVNINASNTAAPQSFVVNTNVTIWLQSVIQNIIGTEQNDTITGTAQNDVILGLGGNDLINGGAGDDTLIGGAGSDTINGDAGNDLIVGDHIAIGTGSQTVGAGGSDVLNGGAGNDTVIGGSLVDCQSAPASTGTAGADGADTLYGGFGSDIIEGDNVIQNCTTAVDGGGGPDLIYGGDSVSGNDGNDSITGGPGADTIYGGNQVGGAQAGNDTINVAGDSAIDCARGGHAANSGNAGTNVINADAGDDTANGHGPCP